MSGSVKWLYVDEKRQLVTNDQVRDVLTQRNKRENINLVSIFGGARQGKSFLMNLLAGEEDLFRISNSRVACTQGSDLSRVFKPLGDFARCRPAAEPAVVRRVESVDNVVVGFADLEGQGDQDVTYDTKLVTPVLLSSASVLFNWKGGLLKDQILDKLAVLAKAASKIERQNGESEHVFGHLHIVFRDWNFRETDAVDQVYKDLFDEENAFTETAMKHNMARKFLVQAFKSINIWLLPPPVAKTEDLSKELKFHNLQLSFLEKVAQLRSKLCEQLTEPTKFAGKRLNGKRICALVPQLVDILNSGETILPTSVFGSMMLTEVGELADALATEFDAALDEYVGNDAEELPTPDEYQAKTKAMIEKARVEFNDSPAVHGITPSAAEERLGELLPRLRTAADKMYTTLMHKHEKHASELGDKMIYHVKDLFTSVMREKFLPVTEGAVVVAFKDITAFYESTLKEQIPVEALLRAQIERVKHAAEMENTSITLENKSKLETLQATVQVEVGAAKSSVKDKVGELKDRVGTYDSVAALDKQVDAIVSAQLGRLHERLVEVVSEDKLELVNEPHLREEVESVVELVRKAVHDKFHAHAALQEQNKQLAEMAKKLAEMERQHKAQLEAAETKAVEEARKRQLMEESALEKSMRLEEENKLAQQRVAQMAAKQAEQETEWQQKIAAKLKETEAEKERVRREAEQKHQHFAAKLREAEQERLRIVSQAKDAEVARSREVMQAKKLGMQLERLEQEKEAMMEQETAKRRKAEEEAAKFQREAELRKQEALAAEERARSERERHAQEVEERQAQEEAARQVAKEKARQEAAEEKARQEAAKEKARQEAAEEKARQEAAKEKARQDAFEEQARQKAAEEQARQDAFEEQAREQDAEEEENDQDEEQDESMEIDEAPTPVQSRRSKRKRGSETAEEPVKRTRTRGSASTSSPTVVSLNSKKVTPMKKRGTPARKRAAKKATPAKSTKKSSGSASKPTLEEVKRKAKEDREARIKKKLEQLQGK